RNMLGHPAPFHEVPWFWSDQYDAHLQMVGRPRADDELVIRGAPDSDSFSGFYLRDAVLAAALSVNRPRDIRTARTLIERGTRLEASALRAGDLDLASLVEPMTS